MFIYIVFGNILRKLLGEGVDEKIGEMYRSGAIVTDMTKPINITLKIMFDDFGRGLFEMFLISIPLLFIFWMKDSVKLVSIQQVLLFLFLIIIAYILNFLIGYILGIITFWTQSNIGMFMLKTACVSIFSGLYIPLDFYPKWLYRLTQFLPFRAIYYLPASVIMKKISMDNLISILSIQFFWIVVISLFLVFIQKKALNRLSIQGG